MSSKLICTEDIEILVLNPADDIIRIFFQHMKTPYIYCVIVGVCALERPRFVPPCRSKIHFSMPQALHGLLLPPHHVARG
jgi:hypothetical protein